MGTHLRFTPVLALIGMLALGGAPAARAQDTSAARPDTSMRSDTSGYQGYGADTMQRAQPTGQADSGAKYNGPPTDTTLKAKPGVQTGPSAADSSKTGMTSQADTVVCKDGSNSPRTGDVCLKHGGIDWTATNAALKARGQAPIQPGDSASADSALKAKPGLQTGPTDSSSMGQMKDSSGMGQMQDTSSTSR